MADIDLLVCHTINASRREPIDAALLAACLRGAAVAPSGVLSAFFTEVPLEAIARFADAHELSQQALYALWRRVAEETLDERPELDEWLGDLAGPAR